MRELNDLSAYGCLNEPEILDFRFYFSRIKKYYQEILEISSKIN